MTRISRTASYYIFLLKLWPERSQENGEALSWRFSLEDPITGMRKGFTDRDSLLSHIRQQLEMIELSVTA